MIFSKCPTTIKGDVTVSGVADEKKEYSHGKGAG